MISEISEAAREQSQGIEQVNSAVGELDREVQQNAANAEQSAAAAQEMNGQAEVMRATASQLIQMVGGHVEMHCRAGLIEKWGAVTRAFRLPKWKIRNSGKTQTVEPRQRRSPADMESGMDEF